MVLSQNIITWSIFAGLAGLCFCQNSPPTWDDTCFKPLYNVSEDTQPGTIITTLKCIDADRDGIIYSLVSGDAFSVQSNGTVRLNYFLDFDITVDNFGSTLEFDCVDVDSSGTPKSIPVPASIKFVLNDANDNPPVFEVGSLEKYEFSIYENAQSGSVLSPSITVRDKDRTENALLSNLYFICDSNVTEELSRIIDTGMCEKFKLTWRQIDEGFYSVNISLKGVLDYETKPVYSSQLIAVDGGPNVKHLTSTVAVQVRIKDSQDRLPFFENEGASTTISEDTPPGTTLNFAVSATDGDKGEGARRRVIIELLDVNNAFFELAPTEKITDNIHAAKVVVKSKLDRETLSFNTFVAKVTELKRDTQEKTTDTATATYTIFLSDVNDNGPVFAKPVYNVDVTEKTNDPKYIPVNLANLQIVCEDKDEQDNAKYRVRIVSQSYPNEFSIFPVQPFKGSGSIFLQVDDPSKLDYDIPEYRNQVVVIEAQETDTTEKFSSSTTVSITVLDINDNAPVFQSNRPRTFNVNENVQTPYVITTVTATDIDSGDNGVVQYRLAGDYSQKFQINANTGELRLIGDVDYEQEQSYIFTVYAVDKGQPAKSAQVGLEVNIQNVNDKGPVFLQPRYQTSANETSLNFTNPLIIIAEDNEADSKAITYRIIEGQTPDNAFFLNPNTGQLSLRQFLDFDNTPTDSKGNRLGYYTLKVEASDEGTPPLTSVVEVTVSIIDENNHAPVLTPKLQTVRISEIEPPGTVIAQVTGTDDDAREFGTITYRLGAGSSGNFRVDSRTGAVTVAQSNSLDYDLRQSYSFLVLATDGGAPQKNDTAEIKVIISDANNKAPSFDKFLYRATVREDDPIGKKVLTMEATDQDTTSQLDYTLGSFSASDKNGNQLNDLDKDVLDYTQSFAIDQSGQIKISGKLDKEIAQEISFVVTATDVKSDTGTQSATAQVTIIIEGDPDTDIRFVATPVSFMNEDESVDFRAATVTASDPQNTPLTFSIVQPSSDFFKVASDGRILLAKVVDFENDRKEHQIIVKAQSTDGRSATTTVTVSINDVNDNAPEFQLRDYVAEVSEMASFPQEVATILATDKDSSSFGPVMYRISGGLGSNDFVLFPRDVDAVVLVADGAKLDYNKRSQYKLDILAIDNPNIETSFSNLRKSSTVTLTINVRDENNHSPDFKDDERSYYVAETAAIGSDISIVEAYDNDNGLNGRIVYSLEAFSAQDEQGLTLFRIDPNLGLISVASSLLGLGDKRYTLKVRARDRGEIPRTDVMILKIGILSTEDDDGNPKWHSPSVNQVFSAPEETVGYQVFGPSSLDVKARTGDSVVFELADTSDYRDSFQMLPDGTLTIIKKLDRERKEDYQLLVYAMDTNDTATLRSGRTVIVRLTDINDNDATFTNPKNYPGCATVNTRPMVIYVKENLAADANILKLSGCDPDAQGNNELRYELFNGTPYCSKGNSLSNLKVSADGVLSTKEVVDYEKGSEYDICVKVSSVKPVSAGRKKRSFNMTEVQPYQDDIAYIEVQVLDENDNSPIFPNKKETAAIQASGSSVVSTGGASDRILTFTAQDPDGTGNNVIVYYITSSVFYSKGSSNPTGANAFRVESGALYTALNSYKQFSGGVFVLTVKAVDALDTSKSDEQTIEIFIYEQGQALKLVLDMEASLGYNTGQPLIEELNDVSPRYAVEFLSVSEHRSTSSSNIARTDVCFMVADTQDKTSMNIPQVLQLLEEPAYKNILSKGQYNYLSTGQCFASKSSEDDLKWKDLWWVLVAVAIFVFACSLILIILALVLHRNYKRYMDSKQLYLVEQ